MSNDLNESLQEPVYWLSPVGDLDDFGNAIFNDFVDGKTKWGPWGIMSHSPAKGQFPTSFESNGVGLGLGRGQHYRKQLDGRWLKVAG